MAGDLTNKQFIQLDKSIEWSNRMLEFPKRKRVEAIEQFVGYHYSNEGPHFRVPIPMIALAVSIYERQLMPQCPRALVGSRKLGNRPLAANMELALNQIPDEINLETTLRRFIMEAIFSMGIVKVGLHSVGNILNHEYGESFVDLVTTDDYFCDMSAKRWDDIDYEGNDYWLPFDDVKDSNWADKDVMRDLQPDQYTTIGPAGELRAETVSADSSADVFREKIWLRDVWIPAFGKLITYGVKSKRILKQVDWTGPQMGPYIKLGYQEVPGNLSFLPPVALWRDLHELENSLFRKLANQADSQKRVLGFNGGNEEEVEDFKKCKDGDGMRYTGQDPKTLAAGGVDQVTLAFFMQAKGLSSYFAGNLDSLGGLAPQTQTLGQDKLLGEAASSQLRDMSARTVSAIADIFHSLAYYEWNDPVKRRILEKPIPGTSLSIPVQFSRESKQGSISQFQFSVDIYSLQDKTPSVQLQKLGMIWQTYILPASQMIQAEGGHIDLQAFFAMLSKYSDFPELEELVIFSDQQAQMPGSGPQSPANKNSTHEYIRTGRPGMTNQGASNMMQQRLMSATPASENSTGTNP